MPQGMMNSPTMCQYYVAKALEPVRKQFPDFLVIHYMDDILSSAPSILEVRFSSPVSITSYELSISFLLIGSVLLELILLSGLAAL